VNDTPLSTAAKSETVRILLVEDDDGSALLIQTSLARWRYGVFEIRRVGDLASAVRAVAQGGIDLVLLDLGLPDSQGLDPMSACMRGRVGYPSLCSVD
jgi:DNA-binding response OmpR family regulator